MGTIAVKSFDLDTLQVAAKLTLELPGSRQYIVITAVDPEGEIRARLRGGGLMEREVVLLEADNGRQPVAWHEIRAFMRLKYFDTLGGKEAYTGMIRGLLHNGQRVF